MLHARNSAPEVYPVFEHSPRLWRLVEAANKPGGIERAPLVALSWLYSLGIAAFLWPYRVGIRKRKRVKTPVVSVGNLVLGGTGKTPVVRWLCESLVSEGLKPCVVSYGYGGSACKSPSVVSDGETIYLGAEEAGDEPAMLARFLPGVPVVVGKRRFEAARLAEIQLSPDVIILDDGFQHWQLHRDLDIVVIDARRPFGNGFTIPAGPLREPVSALRRADMIVLSHSGEVSDEDLRSLRNKVQSLAPNAGIHLARDGRSAIRALARGERRSPLGDQLQIANYKLQIETESSDSYSNLQSAMSNVQSSSNFCAVSSIGTPWSFEKSALAAGFRLACVVRYPDHHAYSVADIEHISDVARANAASGIVTTEKDAVRWPNSRQELPVFVLDTQVEIENGDDLIAVIWRLLGGHGNKELV